jgi:hypothetical protein
MLYEALQPDVRGGLSTKRWAIANLRAQSLQTPDQTRSQTADLGSHKRLRSGDRKPLARFEVK